MSKDDLAAAPASPAPPGYEYFYGSLRLRREPAPHTTEVGEIVKWLRSPAGNELASRDEPHLEIADAIEAGSYRKGGDDAT